MAIKISADRGSEKGRYMSKNAYDITFSVLSEISGWLLAENVDVGVIRYYSGMVSDSAVVIGINLCEPQIDEDIGKKLEEVRFQVEVKTYKEAREQIFDRMTAVIVKVLAERCRIARDRRGSMSHIIGVINNLRAEKYQNIGQTGVDLSVT